METGHEFSDRLNPFIVKELRTGLRSGGYSLMLIALPAVLAVAMIASREAPVGRFDVSGAIMKGILYLMFCIVFPFSGLGSILEERKGRKLELLVLTNLSAVDLVYGKWLVRAMQAGLLVSVTLPFIMMRYFSGGVDMAGEVAFVFMIYLGCLVLNAAILLPSGLLRPDSPLLNSIVRIVTFFVMFFVLWIGAAAAGVFIFSAGGISVVMLIVAMVVAAIATALLLFFAQLTFGGNFSGYRPNGSGVAAVSPLSVSPSRP